MLNLDDIGIDSRLLEIKKPMKYDIYIAKPNKQIIGKIINEYDVNLPLKFGSINELSLTIPYKLYGEKTMIKVDTRFDELLLDIDNFSAKENVPTSSPQPQRNIETIEVKELMYIKLVYMGKTEWFLIDSINDEISDKDEMSIKCYSIPYELKRKKLSTPIEMETTTISGVVDKLLQDTGWKIGNIDGELSDVYRTITLDGGDRYSNINEVAQSYGTVLIWDTVNKQLNISLINNISQNKGLIISSQNLLNSLSRERTTENVITRMYGFGNDDLTFENVNPTGKRYIEDFSFFIYPFKRDVNKNVLLHSSYMSDELAHALLDIEELSKIELPKIKEKQSQIISKNTQLSTVSIELIDTKGQRGITQGLLDIAKATQDIDLITQRKYELKDLDEKIASLEAQEKTISNDISTLQLEISNIQKRISYTALSQELIDELYPFIIDGEFKDDRYIDETDLFNDTKKEFIKNQKPKQVISVDLSTVLQDPENIMYRDKINLGDIVTIKYPDADIDYQEPIVGIDIKLDTFDIKISVSEHDSDLSPMDKIASIIYNTSSSIATFEGKEHKWDAIVNIENEVDKMRNGIIDATKNRIVAGVNESVDIGNRGIIIKNPDYPQNILIMQSGVFALSKDGGETWQTAITPDGVMADTIIGRLLVGNELIISNESGTFKIDGNGLEVDIDSIKIMSGTEGSKEDILSSWNTTINRIAEMANDNVLNEYEKNQLQKQFDAETKIFNDMTKFYISTIGTDGVPSQEYTNLINAYSDMNNLLTKELQSDGFTILDILNRKVTTEVDGVELDRIINNYYASKDTFLTKTPLEFTSTAIKQTMKEISLNYVKNGEVVNEINLSEDGVKIDGSKIEISGDTTFKDDLIMDTGVIRSKDGTSFVLDLKNNVLRLGKTLTIIGNLFVTPSDILKDIIKTEYLYGQSSSPTIVPTTWSTATPTWKENMYIWGKKVQTLRDGTVNELPPVNITGAKGATGASGKDGLPGSPGVGIKSTTITYGVNQSNVTKPTNWAPNVPESNPGDYVWTKTEWIYTNNTKETGYSVSRIGKDGNTGEDGIPGMDGVGIEKTTITYAKNTNGTTAPTTGWGAQVPTTNPGDFVWTKTEWLYTNGVTETGYSVGKIGNTGSQGVKGADGKSTHIAYANSADGTLDFSTSDGTNKKYIGIYVDTNATDSPDPSKYTWTLVKGADGANGLPGKPGENGLTPYFHVAYANSADGTLDFDIADSTNRAYLGQYTDYVKEDSTDPSKYSWTRVTGAEFTWNLLKGSNELTYTGTASDTYIPRTYIENGITHYEITKQNLTAISYDGYRANINYSDLPKVFTISFEVMLNDISEMTIESFLGVTGGIDENNAMTTHINLKIKNIGVELKENVWQKVVINVDENLFSSKTATYDINKITRIFITLGQFHNGKVTFRKLMFNGGTVASNYAPHITEIQGADGSTFTWNMIKGTKKIEVSEIDPLSDGSFTNNADGSITYQTNTTTMGYSVVTINGEYPIPNDLIAEDVGKDFVFSIEMKSDKLISASIYLGIVSTRYVLLQELDKAVGKWHRVWFTAKASTIRTLQPHFQIATLNANISFRNPMLHLGTIPAPYAPHITEIQGADGAPGKGIKDTRYRYAKTSAPSPEPTESQWSTTKPDYNKGDYAWTQVIWEYTDGTVENSAPMMSYIAEDGVGISDTLVAYALSTTNVQPADNLFTPKVPDSKPGDYVWTRVTLDYTDPSKTDSKFYTVARVGRDGVNAKLISLSASEQVFKNNTPATITVTGLAQNTSITSWTYSSNSGAFTATLPAGVTRSGNTVTITQSTMTANTLTIKASDGTYSDTVSIAKLADGTSGTDGFTVLLTNESQTFPANSAGTVTSYASGYSDIVVYYGGTPLTCTTTATGLPTVNNTYTVTAITASAGTVTLTPSLVSSNYRVTPSALTTDNAIRVLTIVARVNNTNYTFKKTLTYTKSKSGANGADATIASTTPPTDTNKLWRDLNEGIVKQFNETTKLWEPFDATIAKELEDYKDTVGTSIGKANESTLITIFESVYTQQKIDELIANTEGTISDVEGNAKSEQERLQDLIDSNKKETDDELEKIGNYFDFRDDGLMIGKKDNPINVLIDNDSLSFYDQGVEVAWFTNEELHVTDTVIERSLSLGNFEFVPRESGNLSFRKKG